MRALSKPFAMIGCHAAPTSPTGHETLMTRVFSICASLLLTLSLSSAHGNETGAEAVFADVRPALLQIRTLVGAGDQQSSIGSGFLVSGQGLAITNYHVVSQYALEPETYQLQYSTPDGHRGKVQLLAIDVIADLALVKLDQEVDHWLEFDERALVDGTPQGERLYAIGNPLDLGFTIVEGTHNGLVEKSYIERVHFSGAMNAGMSGGPTLTGERRIAGINVARMGGGQLVSFLVPPRHAQAMLAENHDASPMSLKDVRAEITAQLLNWQEGLYAAVAEGDTRHADHGRYRVQEPELSWLSCWAGTNAHDRPRPLALVENSRCSLSSGVFIANNLHTGQLQVFHAHVRSEELNSWQFASFVSRLYATRDLTRFSSGSRLTQARCHDSFVRDQGGEADGPLLRAVWCARAYREFDGLFDVDVSTVTQDNSGEALVSQLSMKGVSYANALQQARRFIGSITWAP